MADRVDHAWNGDEAELAGRQGDDLYPVGKALRATYDADNHATLGKDVTVLMLDLARVPFEPHEFEPILPPVPRAMPLNWMARLRLAMRRARQG
jgi:hypothetical protein